MKLNHFVCPNCGHDFYSDCAYGTCDACNCMFYACQSKTCEAYIPTYRNEDYRTNVESLDKVTTVKLNYDWKY